MIARNKEGLHDVVYGKPFAAFTRSDVAQTVKNYTDRYEANGVDPRGVFEGRHCLDVGCGYGRGSLFMLANGAAHVSAVDISATNVQSARRQVKDAGFDNFDVQESSAEALPFDDGAFDAVWCYGVIHHAARTDACLRELSRVLKIGGRLFLFVYGSGGVFWYSMRRFREILEPISADACIAGTRLMGFSPIEVSNFVNSWKVSYLRCYTRGDLTRRLGELGFDAKEPWPWGISYDFNHRRNTYPSDALWMGEGDLRYLVPKTGAPSGPGTPLSDGDIGSQVPFDSAVTERFGPLFDALKASVNGRPLAAIAACGYVHRRLFELFRQPYAFDPSVFAASFDEAEAYLKVLDVAR